MGALDWLFAPSAPQEFAPRPPNAPPPLAQYPTAEDAAFARQNGAWYGSPLEPFAAGQTARVTKDKKKGLEPEPASSIRSLRSDLTDEDRGMVVQTGEDRRFNGRTLPSPSQIADLYGRSALAANRSAVATLGLDPRRANVDVVTPPDIATTYQGLYSPSTDNIFAMYGAEPDKASALTHEALHRGLQKIRELNGGELPPLVDGKNSFVTEKFAPRNEEYLVRMIMRERMGNPETGSEAEKAKRVTNTWNSRDTHDFVNRLEAMAADELARRRPGGPR